LLSLNALQELSLDAQANSQTGAQRETKRYEGEAQGLHLEGEDKLNHGQCVNDECDGRDDEAEFHESHEASSIPDQAEDRPLNYLRADTILGANRL
jgi:hypothetical protein